MAEHMLEGAKCREAYTETRAAELVLVRSLLDSTPPGCRAEILRQIALPQRSPWTQRIAAMNDVVTWGILAIAVSHLLAGEGTGATNVAAFLTGGAAALLYPSL